MPGSDNASLRATIAALAAVAALLAFVLWQSAATTLRMASDEARDEGTRAATLAVARALDATGADPSRDLATGVAAAGRPVAAALYADGGERLAVASAAGLDATARRLPERGPDVTSGGWLPSPVATGPDGPMFAVRMASGRTLVVVQPGRPIATLGGTLAAYEALTLFVALAAIAFAMRRLGRATQARFEMRARPTTTATDGPKREAEFVVETFQSVIGELQTKGRRLELESLRDRERAERSERFSERVIARMPTGLVVVDRSGHVTAANESARELFAELPRVRTDAVDYTVAFRDAAELIRMVGECLREGEAFTRREIEMRGRTGGLGVRCLGISVSPIASGRSTEAALCLMTDLTEVVELRDRVRMQETMASLGEMAAGLTHELKNSLATIQGYAQLIADIAPDAASESADDLVDEVGHLARMVTDFLNFARPQDIARTPVGLTTLLTTVLERLEPAIESGDVTLAVSMATESDELRVLGDETLLGRAFHNVLQNAVEALETVDTPRRLAVSIVRNDDEVVVAVSDNGPGIKAEDLPKIFIPFFTTRSRGHGIGLALTQKIILAHGGRISAESSAEGTTFRFVLPSAPADDRVHFEEATFPERYPK